MKLTKTIALAFVATVTALPTLPSTEDVVALFNITDNDLMKRAPYGYVCNNENPPLDWQDQLSCYQEIHDWGVRGGMCGAEKLCFKNRIKVMSTLWQTNDKSFKLNCVELSEAVRTVMNLCQQKGGKLCYLHDQPRLESNTILGSAGVPTKPGWTHNRQDLLVTHIRSTWLNGRSLLNSVKEFTRRYLVNPVARAVNFVARRELVEQITTAPAAHEPVPEGMRFYVEKGGNVIWYRTVDELASRQLVDPITFNVSHTEANTYPQSTTSPASTKVKPVERQKESTEYVSESFEISAYDPRSIGEEAELARRTEVIRRAPYTTICNNENVSESDQSYCQAWFRLFGGDNDRCGATKLCEYGGVKVSGTLWETTDKNYATKCKSVSNAIQEVWKTCGKRGGKLLYVLLLHVQYANRDLQVPLLLVTATQSLTSWSMSTTTG
jgi:hypothetical protein